MKKVIDILKSNSTAIIVLCACILNLIVMIFNISMINHRSDEKEEIKSSTTTIKATSNTSTTTKNTTSSTTTKKINNSSQKITSQVTLNSTTKGINQTTITTVTTTIMSTTTSKLDYINYYIETSLIYNNFSKQGLINEINYNMENCTKEEIVEAVENYQIDFKEQAVKRAKKYLKLSSGFSEKTLLNQLKFDKFTEEEALYGLLNSGADWNEEAIKKAENLKVVTDSKSTINTIMEQDGFTTEQIQYAFNKIGIIE